MDWKKGWKVLRMLWFLWKNRNNLQERVLRIMAELEGIYDQWKEELNKD